MRMKEIRSAAILGLGALGILFGRPMADHSDVVVIADEARIRRYRSQPGLCNGKPYRFHYLTPQQGKPVDLILVATKATALADALPRLAPFVGEDTVILSLLNGITSEEKIEAVYPGHCLWSVAIHMDATRQGRNLLYKNMGKIQFGEKNGGITPRVQAVSDYFTRCEVPHEVCTDMVLRQWNKLMINDGLNQVTAACGLTYGGLQQSPEAQQMMLSAMEEVIGLARLEGVPLPADAHKVWARDTLPIFAPEGMPSMAQDVRAKRPTEVEEFAGEVIRRAKRYGLPTPVNEELYAGIRRLESEY